MNKPNSNRSSNTFSCEKNTIGFNQPKNEHLTSSGLWRRRDKLVEELIDLMNATKVSSTDNIKIQEYSKIQSIIKEQREIDPDWHLVVRQQGEGCLRISHYDCYCNSGNDSECDHKTVSLVKPRTLRDVTEIVKSIQETMNAINTNISFDENTGTMIKLYFFIKELRRIEPNRIPCIRGISRDPSKESKA
jgi:hypothetical protein